MRKTPFRNTVTNGKWIFFNQQDLKRLKMARKRMIDPAFWTDEEVGIWSFEARLFFLGLLNFADDEGRIKANSNLLKAQIFPYNPEIPVDNLKKEISKKVVWYDVEGIEYGFIRKFNDYQSISHPQKSKLPAVPKSFMERSRNDNGTLRHNQSSQSDQSSQISLVSLSQSVKDIGPDFFTQEEETILRTELFKNGFKGKESQDVQLRELWAKNLFHKPKKRIGYAITSIQNLVAGK